MDLQGHAPLTKSEKRRNYTLASILAIIALVGLLGMILTWRQTVAEKKTASHKHALFID